MDRIVNGSKIVKIESYYLSQEAAGIYHLIINTNLRWEPFRIEKDGEKLIVFFGKKKLDEKTYLECVIPLSSPDSFLIDYTNQCKNQLCILLLDAKYNRNSEYVRHGKADES